MPRWIMEVKLDSGGLCFAPPGLDNTRPSSHRLPLSRKCMMAATATATATAKVVRIVRRRPRPAPLGLGTSSWWCGGGWMNGGDAQATHPNPASEPPPFSTTHARKICTIRFTYAAADPEVLGWACVSRAWFVSWARRYNLLGANWRYKAPTSSCVRGVLLQYTGLTTAAAESCRRGGGRGWLRLHPFSSILSFRLATLSGCWRKGENTGIQ